jgi:glycosyltransferase involved in cell wall biosynthesis
MTTVQIIIVLFNSESHIQCCLSGLEKQSFSDFEVIIVDNNSIDKSVEFLEKTLVLRVVI